MSLEGKITENNESSAAQQAARSALRESFLMTLNKISGESCKILTYEKSLLHGTFAAWNPENQDILVRNLKTPANISIKSALLRSTDILSLQFDLREPVDFLLNT